MIELEDIQFHPTTLGGREFYFYALATMCVEEIEGGSRLIHRE